MRGVYTASYRINNLTAARTLMYLTAPANKVVEILGAKVSNEDNETNEQLALALQRITSLGTPTATTVTPAPSEAGDAAAASTVKANVTGSEPTYGAIAQDADIVGVLDVEGCSSLGGYRYTPTPEERPTVGGGASIGLRLLNAPTSYDCVVSLTFREIG